MLGLAIALLAAAYAAVFSFAIVARSSNPTAALLVRPLIPEATTRLADLRIFAATRAGAEAAALRLSRQTGAAAAVNGLEIAIPAADQQAVEALARRTLGAAPLSSDALRQLAYLERQPNERLRLLTLAQAVSKRDTMASIQLAQARLQGRDAEAAIDLINQALVVSSSLDVVVFPILMNAAVDPQISREVGALLRDDPAWSERLVRWALNNPSALPALSGMLDQLPRDSAALAVGYGQQMVDLLTQQGQFAAAFAAYDAYSPRPQDVGELLAGNFPPIDWRLIDEYDTGSRPFEQAVELFASAGRQGDAAQIITRLPPGTHRLAITLDETVGADGRLQVAVACVGTEERTIANRPASLRDGTIMVPFQVSAGCPHQRISLGIAAGNEAAGALLRAVAVDGAAALRRS